MHILSINIGSARTIGNANVSGQTGIYKLPVAGPVQVTRLTACLATRSSAPGTTAGRTRRSTSTAARITRGGRASWGGSWRPARSART